MKTDNIERYLNSFGKYIVQQAKSNLTKGKKNVSKDLYRLVKDDFNFTERNEVQLKGVGYINSYFVE